MKICLVSQEYPPETGGGGIGTQTYSKAHGLSALGHEVHVVSASCDQKERTYSDGDVVIHRIPYPILRVPKYEESTLWLAYSNSVAEKLNLLASQVSFDIIQFPEYGAEGFIYQTNTFRYRKASYVIQLHGPFAMFVDRMGWPDPESTFCEIGCFMEKMVIHHADLVFAESRNIPVFVAERYSYPIENIKIITGAIDSKKFSPLSQPYDERQPKILFVGNLSENKGITLLMNAVFRLKERYPKICLRAVGGKGKKLELEKTVAAFGAQSNFEFIGYLPYEKLPEQYAWCDFFAGPSTHEPGPANVYREAMACGKPVIACDSGGAPEIVIHNKTGLLIKPGDIESLEEAIITLTENVTLRELFGKNGRKFIEEHYSVEKYSKRIEHLYQQLLC